MGQAVVLGIQIPGIWCIPGESFLGCVSAYVHNRFIDTEFNNAFQIYGGARFVFIVLIPVIIILAVVLTYAWPPVQMVIDSLGYFIQQNRKFWYFYLWSIRTSFDPYRPSSSGLYTIPVYKTGWYRTDRRPGIRRMPKYLLCRDGRSVYFNFIVFCSNGMQGDFQNVWSRIGARALQCITQQDPKTVRRSKQS